MRIKAKNFLKIAEEPRTYPAVVQDFNQLKDKYQKFMMYIKTTLGALSKGPEPVPVENQKELSGYLNTLQQAYTNVSKVLSQKHPVKWDLSFSSLGQLKSLTNQIMEAYDRAIPESPLKPVYRDTVNIAVDEFLPVVDSLTNNVIDANEDARARFPTDKPVIEPKEEKKEEPKKEEPKKEEPKKEEPKKEEKVPEPKEEPKEEKKYEVKDEENFLEEPKKEEPKEEVKEELKEELEIMSPKEIKSLKTKVSDKLDDAKDQLKHFTKSVLKKIPNRGSFEEGKKVEKFLKTLDKFSKDVNKLYTKSPEDRAALSKNSKDLMDEFNDLVDKVSTKIKEEHRPTEAKDFTKELREAQKLIDDVYELLTFGRTFKRANKIASINIASNSDLQLFQDTLQNLNVVEFDDNTDETSEFSILVIVEDQYSNTAVGIYPEKSFDPNVVDDLIEAVEEVNPEAKIDNPQILKVHTEEL